MYGKALAALGGPAGGPPGLPPPAAMGAGMGAPPSMPDLPPAPTGVGAIPLGDPGSTPKGAADEAILTLRTASGHFPALKPMLDATIDALKAAAKPKSPAGPPGAAPPGAPPPGGALDLAPPPPSDLAGAPGAGP